MDANESVINSLLQPEEPDQEPEATEEQSEVEDDADNPDEGSDVEEASDEGEEPEYDETDEDEGADPADEAPETFRVKVDGQEVEVTLDELKNGYSGSRAIRQRMQEAHDKRQEAEAVYTALQQEQQRLSQLYQELTQKGAVRAPEMPDVDYDSDPIGAAQAWSRYNAEKAAYDRQQDEFQQMSQQSRQAQEQAMRAHLEEQQQIIAREIPEYMDPDKGPALKRDMRETAKSYGFSDDELSQITDARVVRLLNDLVRGRKATDPQRLAEKKVERPSKNVKPRGTKRVSPEKKHRQQLRQQLKKTGDARVAAELLIMPDKET